MNHNPTLDFRNIFLAGRFIIYPIYSFRGKILETVHKFIGTKQLCGLAKQFSRIMICKSEFSVSSLQLLFARIRIWLLLFFFSKMCAVEFRIILRACVVMELCILAVLSFSGRDGVMIYILCKMGSYAVFFPALDHKLVYKNVYCCGWKIN